MNFNFNYFQFYCIVDAEILSMYSPAPEEFVELKNSEMHLTLW